MGRPRGRVFVAAALTAWAQACRSEPPRPPVQVAATAEALDETTVEVQFTKPLGDGAIEASDFRVFAPFREPMQELQVLEITPLEAGLVIRTGPQRGGELYALTLPALRFLDIDVADAPTQLDFMGYGKAQVVLTLDARGFTTPERIDALVTFSPSTGEFSETLQRLALSEGPEDVFTATASVRIDPGHVFGARAVGPDDTEASTLSTFAVDRIEPIRVFLEPALPRVPEFGPPIDVTPGDGRAPVRFILDDRYARALRSPALRSSVDANGRFDFSASRVDALRPVPGKGRVFETVLEVAVDPARRLDGTTPENFPYVSFLVESGGDYPQRGATFTMPTETPQVIVIPVGNPEKVPVTFRIDAGAAFLSADGRARGVYPGEGVFLTGELPSAEDALGQLAADAFTGGERASLEMAERPDAPGIYEKTIFLPKNRPYGWKVVRCASGRGCAELNRHVVSSGRAFPTVMKNLTTANVDGAQSTATRLIDPANLGAVAMEDGRVLDYSSARVSESGSEAPGTSVMFKQEVPDLVVTVGEVPVVTPIYVVGTWRDINIPQSPQEIIDSGGLIDLAQFDYDDGMQGLFPLTRDLELPLDPALPATRPGEPAFDGTDGTLDTTAVESIAASGGRLPLWLAWNERVLYAATSAAAAGRDRFVVVSFDPPSGSRAAPWAKGGACAQSPRQIFLSMEGNGAFQGWFVWGGSPMQDTLLQGANAQASAGQVLEGAIDLGAAGIGTPGDRIWVSVLEYGTNDGDVLISAVQSPAGNGDGNVDGSELLEVQLSTVRPN